MDHSVLQFILMIGWAFAPTLIYLDATNHRIGRIKGEKSFFNMPAGGWAIATLLLMLITIPLYIFKRPELLAKAAENPVLVSMPQRIAIVGILLIIGLKSLY